jgi:lysophospholipase L1-like esterase
VIFLATIAPLKTGFGKGPGGVNWDIDTAWLHALKIQSHIEAGLAVAAEINLPVIDCYHLTLQDNGEGISKYVNSHDGIHPSEAGHQYIARLITEKLISLKFL